MKRSIARVTLMAVSIATLYLSLAPAARAQDDHTCSTANAAGKWGFTLTGTLVLATGPVPGAGAGTITADTAGNLSGTEARNVGGGFANETLSGKWTVGSDCTGTASFKVYQSGALVRETVFSAVFTENSSEFLAVEQSLTLPDGTNVPAVITVEAKRLSPDKGSQR